MPKRVIWNSEPGTIWVNCTDTACYQFICSLRDTCGGCLQYHMAVSNSSWAIPFHRGCQCRQVAVHVGRPVPNAFVDVQKLFRELPVDQKIGALGDGVWQLVDRGVIEFREAVTKFDVKSLAGIVAWKRLTVEMMIGAGIDRALAEKVYAEVHTPEQDAIRARRDESLQRLRAAGLSDEQIAAEIARRITFKVVGRRDGNDKVN
jgi:hypothetical protein